MFYIECMRKTFTVRYATMSGYDPKIEHTTEIDSLDEVFNLVESINSKGLILASSPRAIHKTGKSDTFAFFDSKGRIEKVYY